MEKITNFEGINLYFCTECKAFHKRTFKRNKISYPSKIFKEHQDFAVRLTNSEKWAIQFKRNWKQYNNPKRKNHKEHYGSKKQ